MDRQIVYSGQVPQTTDLLNTNRQTMIALAKLCADLFGTSTVVSGLNCVPTSPASMSVSINSGQIYQQANLDGTPYSALPQDTAHSLLKQGILMDAQSFTLTAPATTGYSQNYLIQAAYLDNDINNVVLPYYNSANPSQAFNGPGGNGNSQPTTRAGQVSLQLVAGTSAATGSQTTPAVTSGYVGLWVITVANGQGTIAAGNISQYPGAPILPSSILQSIQTGNLSYNVATGTANAHAVALTPALTQRVDGMVIRYKAPAANTGPVTLNDGLGAISVVGAYHQALQGGEYAPNGDAWVQWNNSIGGGSYVLLECTGGAIQIAPAAQSQQALQLGQLGNLPNSQYVSTTGKVNGVNNPNLVPNGSGELGNAGWLSSNFGATTGLTGEGTLFANSAPVSSTTVDVGTPIAMSAGITLNLSSLTWTGGMSSGHANVDVVCYDSSMNPLGTIATNVTNFGQTSYKFNTASGTTPAGTAFVALRKFCDTSPIASAYGICFRRIKLEQGNQPSLHSLEADFPFIRGSFNGSSSYSTSVSLTASQLGQAVVFFGSTASQTITLPTATGLTPGQGFHITNVANVPVTVACGIGTDTILVVSFVNSVVLQPGDDLWVYNNGGGNQWGAFGSAVRQFNPLIVGAATLSQHAVNLGQFANSFASNGYQKLPSGLIVQWGTNQGTATSYQTYSFPVAFPNAVYSMVGTTVNVTTAYTGRINVLSLSQFQVGNSNGQGLWAADPVAWIAIGR